MSDEKQHINTWADKLQDISLPDEGLAWEGMLAMLDNDQPQAKKKDYRRWVSLIILLMLLLGVCNCPKGIRNGLYNAGNTDTALNEKDAIGKQNTGLGEYDTASYPKKDVYRTNVPIDSFDKGGSYDVNGKVAITDTVETNKLNDGRNTGSSDKIKAQDKSNATPACKSKDVLTTGEKGIRNSGKTNARIQHKKPVNVLNTAKPNDNKRTGIASKKQKNKKSVAMLDSSYGTANAIILGRRRNWKNNGGEITGSADVKLTAGKTKGNISPNNNNVKQGSTTVDTGQLKLPIGDDIFSSDSSIIKGQKNKRQQIIKDSTNRADSLKKASSVAKRDSIKTDSATPAKNKDKKEKSKENGWAAAVGLNQFFAIGGQQRSTLNADGVTGTWKDYLPVPQVRYYFNRKLYVQLEAQFNAPQYTQTLLGKFIAPDSSGNGFQTSVFIKKLFYFNLPLSVHYSPFNNFYLGTGLQFSRLSNGVGTVEGQRYFNGRPDSTNVDIKTQSLKSDSLYKRIATTEFRWLVDANYHLNNFTLGIRYNQAFNNFINIQISSTQLTQARNNSLQAYLRYTFWRSKKLKENSIF